MPYTNLIKSFSVKIQFKIMNSSIITSNVALSSAYEHIQNGKIELALHDYQKALRDTFSDDLKINIKCTMAILEQSLGHYDKTIEIMSSIITSSKQHTNSIVKLRLYTNLTLMHIL
jgi:predicted negative regulator of RcsB-dependent stress response